MPPRRPSQRQARPSGSDPTVSISAAAGAKTALYTANEEEKQEASKQETTNESNTNDDLKKLIETLKNKLNSGSTQQKSAPPVPKAKTVWNRSIVEKDRTFNPAYTVLTRISNHEKVPVKSTKSVDITTKSLPDSFIFRPGADGIKIDKLSIQAGKQLGMG